MSNENLKLPTKCAHWGWDDHRYFGYSVFGQLAGRETMVGLTAIGVLGRRIPKDHCEMLDDILCISTLADPRIWPLKITRLVAAYGAVMPAIAAGTVILQHAIVSPWMAADAALTLHELYSEVAGQVQNRLLVVDAMDVCFKRHGTVAGFGMPCRNTDERLIALRACVQRRGRDGLPYWSLVTAILECSVRFRASPNIGLGIAAVMLDMGIATSEIGPLTSALFQHMFFANAVEGARARSADLRELPPSSVHYSGIPPRVSPRARVPHSTFRPRYAQRMTKGRLRSR